MSKLPSIPWIVEMEAVLGWHEVRDQKRLAAWLKSDGATLGDPTKLPWCGDAVDTALELALPDEPRPADLGKNPYWALNWSYLGKKTLPCYGAIAAFKRPAGGHVGFLVAESTNHYLVLGGNQGDTVSRVWIAKDRARAIRWPSTFVNPNAPLPKMAKGSAAVSQNEA